jgi:hypothetical protein
MLTAGFAALALSALIFALYAYRVARNHGGQPDTGTGRLPASPRIAFVAVGVILAAIILAAIILAALLLLLREAAQGELEGWEGAVLLAALMTLALALMTVSWLKESHGARAQPRPGALRPDALPGAMAGDRPMPSRRLGWLGRESTAHAPSPDFATAEDVAHPSSKAVNRAGAPSISPALGTPAIPIEPRPRAMPLMTAHRVFATTRMGAPGEADEPAMAVLARGPLRSSILPFLPEEAVLPDAGAVPPADTAGRDRLDIPAPPASAVEIAMPDLAERTPPQPATAKQPEPGPAPLTQPEPAAPFMAPPAAAEALPAVSESSLASPAPSPSRAPLATDFDWLPQPAQRPAPATAPEWLAAFNIAPPAIQPTGMVAPPHAMAASQPEELALQAPAAEPWSQEHRSMASKLQLIGGIDMVMPRYQLFGWAADASGTTGPEAIEIVALRQGVEIGRARPQELRDDLRHINQGNCGFTMQVTTPLRFAELADGTVEVRAQVGGQMRVLPPSDLLRTVSTVAAAVAGMSEAVGGLDPGDVAEILQGLVRTREIDERIAARCIDLHAALLAQAGRQLERRP